MPKDWPHVVKAIGIVNWVISLCMVDRLSMETFWKILRKNGPIKILHLYAWCLWGLCTEQGELSLSLSPSRSLSLSLPSPSLSDLVLSALSWHMLLVMSTHKRGETCGGSMFTLHPALPSGCWDSSLTCRLCALRVCVCVCSCVILPLDRLCCRHH